MNWFIHSHFFFFLEGMLYLSLATEAVYGFLWLYFYLLNFWSISLVNLLFHTKKMLKAELFAKLSLIIELS